MRTEIFITIYLLYFEGLLFRLFGVATFHALGGVEGAGEGFFVEVRGVGLVGEYVEEGVESEEDVVVDGFEFGSLVEGVDLLDGVLPILVVEVHVPVDTFHFDNF